MEMRMPKHKINSSKKGILFTLVTIILFLLMLGELITYIIININYNNLSTSASVILDSGSFAQSASAGASAFLHDSLRTSLNALIYYESNPSLRKDYFVNNTALVLKSLINNGTILGNTILKGYMGNSTMSSFLASLKTQAAYQNLNLNIANGTLAVYQGSPFTLNASFTALAIVNSSQGTFTYPIKAQASISLNGTADLYEVESANPQQIRVMNNTLVTVVGNTRAAYGSNSPFMFDYGTILVESSGISCASVPSQYMNSNYILATSSATAINQSVCNMGGLVTYTPNTITPLKPYLVYSPSSNIFNYLQNGTKLLLSGSSLSLLNISGLKSAYNNNYYYPSLSSPSYLDSAEGNLAAHSGNGMFSLYSLNRHVAQFNGQSSYISGSTANLPLGSSAGSAFAWVYINAYPTSSNAVIEDYGVATTAEGRGIYITTTGNLCFTGWADDYCSSFTVPLNTWTSVGYVYTGGTNVVVYMNGLGNSGSVSTVLNTQSGLNLIGKRLDNAAPYISGEISDVQIYNTSLSASQMQQLYQEGIGSAPISSAGLVGWWPLNGNANDYSGNGNNGVPVNVAYTNLNNYVGNPLSYGTVGNKYNYQTVAGFGCSNTANCVSSSLFMPNQHYTLGAINGTLLPNVVQFNGQNGYIGTSNIIVTSSNTITETAWVYMYPTTQAYSGIAYYGSQSTCGQTFAPYMQSTGLPGLSDWCSNFNPSGNGNFNNWNFVAFVQNGPNVALYYNNEQFTGVISTNTLNMPTGTGEPVDIGSGQFGAGQYFHGYIADIQLYNIALSASQVQDLYLNNSVPGVQPIAYWPLSGGLNGLLNVTPDVIGGYTGQLYGNPSGGMCTNSNVINGQCGVNYAPA
jgi:hypothetical protein